MMMIPDGKKQLDPGPLNLSSARRTRKRNESVLRACGGNSLRRAFATRGDAFSGEPCQPNESSSHTKKKAALPTERAVENVITPKKLGYECVLHSLKKAKVEALH
jgi:hypothetical protein